MEAIPTLRVLLKVSVASFSLNLAAEKAVEVLQSNWYHKAHNLAKITGLHGLGSLLGCFGLGFAFLSVACGIAMGSGVAMLIMKGQDYPVLPTGFTGLTILLGCGIGGALIGSTLITILMMGMRSLFLMGILLSLILFCISQQQKAKISTITTILSILALAFMTMLLGVWLGMTMAGYKTIDPGKAIIPSLFFTILCLLPAGCLVGSLAEMAFGKPCGVAQLSFGMLVVVTGILLGLGAGYHPTANPRFSDTFFTIRSVVYIVEILNGLVGAVLGVISFSSLEEGTPEGLSMWISIPASVILYNLHVDLPHTGLHGLTEWFLGTGGEVGLILGLAGASGVSLGSVVVSAGNPNSIWQYAILVFAVECGAFYKDSLSFSNLVVSMALMLAPVLAKRTQNTTGHGSGNAIILLPEAALSIAALGAVMIGAMTLGAAGLLTAALGSVGFYGIVLAAIMTIMKAINISREHN